MEKTNKRGISKERKKRIFFITVVFVILLLFSGFGFILPNLRLKKAIDDLNAGRYADAILLLEKAGTGQLIAEKRYKLGKSFILEGKNTEAYILLDELYYIDSSVLIKDLKKNPETEAEVIKYKLLSAEKGSRVKFGSYEQDDDFFNGKEKMSWIVLEKDENKALLISEYVIGSQPLSDNGSIKWEESIAWKWMNDDFLKEAFNENELSFIQPHPTYQDMLFFLDTTEGRKYFSSASSRRASATKKAIQENKKLEDAVTWWLCSDDDDYTGGIVQSSGEIDIIKNNAFCDTSKNGVRPALYVKLN